VKTLSLTSPHTKGADVKLAQRLLNRSPYGCFGPVSVDGDFGSATAAATKVAKRALGYPEKQINSAFGDALRAYLIGSKKLPASYRARRALRARQDVKAKTLGEKALAFLISKLGEKESPPESNRVSWASEWYGVIGPWCAMAVTRAYVEAGSKVFRRGSKFSYCPYIVNAARAGDGLVVTRDPKPGDVVLYDWNGDGVADHVGLFEKWVERGAFFYAIEGNTAVGNDSNGGEVMRRSRSVKTVVMFARVTS
jgi:peptidoglycan hydrolase-like protein with peptidoglycan-binding domain